MKLKIILAALLVVGAASPAFAKKPAPSIDNTSTGMPVCDQVLAIGFKCEMAAAKTQKQTNRVIKEYSEGKAGFKKIYDDGHKGNIEAYTNFCQLKLAQFQKTGCARVETTRPGEDTF